MKKRNDELYWSLRNNHDLSEFVASFLAANEIITEDNFYQFLNPKIFDLMPCPLSIMDMDIAVNYIIKAIKLQKRIAVFADYDVDGATSAALIIRFFRSLNTEVTLYVPDRIAEGYGPNEEAILKLYEAGIQVIITVDCGTIAFQPLEVAASRGIDVIVIDHHIGAKIKPRSIAVLNPNRIDETSDLTYLCGVGVCFMFCAAIILCLERRKANIDGQALRKNLLSMLDLVALGTICDIVPLIHLNRAFVSSGIKIINKRKNIGIAAMASIAELHGEITASHLGFTIGPMINAGGRIGKSDSGGIILSTNNAELAKNLAIKLKELNQERANIEQNTIQLAVSTISNKAISSNMIFASSKQWHQGIIGIVASRIKDMYHKPAIIGSELLDCDGSAIIKASCRSISGINIGNIVLDGVAKNLLLKGGGHSMAAGFTMLACKVDEFLDFVEKSIDKYAHDLSKDRVLELHSFMALSAVNALTKDLSILQPFGSCNQAPVIVIRDVIIAKIQEIKNSHMRITLKCNHSSEWGNAIAFRAIGSNFGDFIYANRGKIVDIACSVQTKIYMGKCSVDMIIVDAMQRNIKL